MLHTTQIFRNDKSYVNPHLSRWQIWKCELGKVRKVNHTVVILKGFIFCKQELFHKKYIFKTKSMLVLKYKSLENLSMEIIVA